MHKHTATDYSGNRWERVSVQKARAAFLDGSPVTICPCKLRPWGFWSPQFTIRKDDETHEWELQHYGPVGVWERLINSAIAYNCSSATGYYLAYYLQQ